MQKLAYKVIEKLADGQFHSGEALADTLGVTRASIWKAIKSIQGDLGLEVHCIRGRGYRLSEPLELLSQEAIVSRLPSDLELSGIEVHFELDSTNSYLLAEAGSAGHPRAVFAERQRAGRGRRGRQWVSPISGNLYFSLSWPSALAPASLSGMSLVVGIAVCDVLCRYLPAPPKLKWPNDIFVGQRKLGGVLVDLLGEAQGPALCVVGIGLNVHLPKSLASEIEQPWIDLRSLSARRIPRNILASELLTALLHELRIFEQEGMAGFMGRWAEYDLCYGHAVHLQLAQGMVEGTAAGIDEQGALLIEHNGKTERYYSGEVSLRIQSGTAAE